MGATPYTTLLEKAQGGNIIIYPLRGVFLWVACDYI